MSSLLLMNGVVLGTKLLFWHGPWVLKAAQRCHIQALVYMSLPAAWPEAEHGKPSHHPKLPRGLDHTHVQSARNQYLA
jgi:hypothetical protein